MLQVGKSYIRGEIRILLGGVMDYLPHQDGQVVYGCFKKETNPNAPDIVPPGRGPGIQHWAKIFRAQINPIPVFIKRAVNEWEYVGIIAWIGGQTSNPKSRNIPPERTGMTSRAFWA